MREASSEDRHRKLRMIGMQLLGGAILLATAMFLQDLPPTRAEQSCTDPCVPGSEDIMSQKEHGTSHTPVQDDLRWGCDGETADRICNYNRHYAEYAGYWETTSFLDDIEDKTDETFFDSNTGNPLFTAPKDRTWDDFIAESKNHGWPSFRDNEVNWEYVRVLSNGETVSVDGTHLGHNLPDSQGNRFCINLVSIAGRPAGEEEDSV
mmetsp:Transcript_133916/g.199142  ORF Transcript_133916/g.199142 Transcript_133916/m.199142 type:complete len:207 (-) Transcript_133916:40-660(-)